MLFEAWLKAFLQIAGIGHYDIWLCGGFLQQKWDTWDVDIVLTGPLEFQSLEQILRQGLDLALNQFRLLVDIQHCNVAVLEPFAIDKEILITKTVLSPLISKNGVLLTDWTLDPSLRRLGPNLWQVDRVIPDDIQVARIQAGLTYSKPPLLLHKRTIKQ